MYVDYIHDEGKSIPEASAKRFDRILQTCFLSKKNAKLRSGFRGICPLYKHSVILISWYRCREHCTEAEDIGIDYDTCWGAILR